MNELEKVNKQIEVLQESIDVWKDKKKQRIEDMKFGTDNCPCCREWLKAGPKVRACDGCPIKEYTGLPYCEKTPYNTAAIVWETVKYSYPTDIDLLGEAFYYRIAQAISNEIDFLYDVLTHCYQKKAALLVLEAESKEKEKARIQDVPYSTIKELVWHLQNRISVIDLLVSEGEEKNNLLDCFDELVEYVYEQRKEEKGE